MQAITRFADCEEKSDCGLSQTAATIKNRHPATYRITVRYGTSARVNNQHSSIKNAAFSLNAAY